MLTYHNGYAIIASMKNYNTNISKSQSLGNKIENSINHDKRRVTLERRIGAGVMALAIGTGTIANLLPANTETNALNNNNTGVSSIDSNSRFDTLQSPVDNVDTITIRLAEKARLRENPAVPSLSDPTNIHYEIKDQVKSIEIDYEASNQEDIPIMHHEGYPNPDWIGLPVEKLPEDLQKKIGRDKDGIVWVSSEMASVSLSDSSNEDQDPTKLKFKQS